MTTTLKSNTQLVVPASVQRRVGLKLGDQVEFKVSGSVVTIIPKLSSVDDEYTAAQRRAIAPASPVTAENHLQTTG